MSQGDLLTIAGDEGKDESQQPPSEVNGGFAPIEAHKILDLCESLSNVTSSIEVQRLINKFLQEMTGAPYVFLIPLLAASEEGLIQVIGDKVLEKEIRFSITSNDIKGVSTHGFQFLISDINRDFTEMIAMVVGDKHNTLIFNMSESTSAPLNDCQPQLSFFVCMAGDDSLREYYKHCINEVFRYTLGQLLTSIELAEEKRVRGQCQSLLRVARRLLRQIGDLGQLLRGVMAEAKDLAGAERCSLFLVDKDTGELVSKVFDGDEATHEVRIEEGKGIAGHVAMTGKLLNIRNAYQHPMFYKGVDELTGFKTRNILCFPICDEIGTIGVAQLCNKLGGFHFDKCDEEVATAFSIYCGIAIMHALGHKRVQKAEARHKLSQELLIYHMKVPEEDVRNLLTTLNQPTPVIENFASFTFCPRDIDRSITVNMAMKMFFDLDFVKKFKMRRDKLARFLLVVQKGYRDTIPYHNWLHAFSAAHFAYCLVRNLRLIERGFLSDLQSLSFLIACFCHDLDHRGTNNSYQMESKSTLARLYSSEGSVNERHHLSQAICILNDENSKILDCLSTDQFKECIDYLRELILATDLANHFRIFKQLKNLTQENLKDNTMLLMSLLITCCDLSDQIKPWPTTHYVAELVYEEFFTQGDLEKQMGLAPNEMMDRQKACIPELQIEFIATVVRPTFEILANLFPETQYFLEVIDNNRKNWEATIGTICKYP
ncbi:unnamed protein product [Hermetia illucens]|uniref:Phosphodiesterase n=1 Tax=Hermetia illucens TaxID=343691 RepID=A0A7R8YVJ2_HERIL|nr:cGMP-dependent 3',5'-cyclic phosphodiesterase-like [Hermetia illucens]CAD7085831.1 unnamed protein product [Hermetia illucens]